MRTACGDELERRGDSLVIRAALPIDDLEPAPFRPPLLIVSLWRPGERFVLVDKRGAAQRPVYTLRLAGEGGLYEPEGKHIAYEPERHLERRQEARRAALAWVLWIPTVPLLPFLGLLPEGAKEKLIHLGVDPGRASRLSIGLEWMLTALLLIAYPFLGGPTTLVGFCDGALTLFLAADIAYRMSADYDGKAPGMFALAGALATWLQDLVGFARGREDLLSEEERTKLIEESIVPRVARDVPLRDDRPPDEPPR